MAKIGNNLKPTLEQQLNAQTLASAKNPQKPLPSKGVLNPKLKMFFGQFDGGPYEGRQLSMEDIMKLAEFEGLTDNYSEFRKKGVTGIPREELEDAPRVKGYIGPMYDKDGLLRYQTQDIYDMMNK